jgi:hypothetical protein
MDREKIKAKLQEMRDHLNAKNYGNILELIDDIEQEHDAEGSAPLDPPQAP